MTYLNEGFWQKAYLIEFKKNGVVTDAFTFSVPPQSEDFNSPQRLNETKTFGGVVFDDYGNDTVNITLSGTSINQALKKIYCSDKGFKYLNGEEEMFYFKNLVKKYGKKENLKRKEVYLYELKSGAKQNSAKWWNGLIKDFTIKRSKDSPFTYFYTLNFVGAPEISKRSLPSGLQELLNKIQYGIDKISEKMSFLEKGLSTIKKGLDYVAFVKQAAKMVHNEVLKYSEMISGYASISSNYIKETFSLADVIIKEPQRVTLGAGLNIFVAASDLNSATKQLVDYFRNLDEKEITSDLLEEYNGTAKEIIQKWTEVSTDTEDVGCSIVRNAKTLNNKVGTVVIPGSDNTNDEVIVTYGYKKQVLKKGDTWDSVATKVYGDSDKASLLASYNTTYNKNLKDITNIDTGDVIYIPILTEDQSVSDNEIYNNPDQKDVYGVDINVTSTDFEIANNDYVVIDSTDNLSQAINNRLTTVLGSRIRDEVYGIRSGVGDPSAASSFILASIETTLADEPRIKSVENIQFVTENEKLKILIDYTDINNETNSYRGEI